MSSKRKEIPHRLTFVFIALVCLFCYSTVFFIINVLTPVHSLHFKLATRYNDRFLIPVLDNYPRLAHDSTNLSHSTTTTMEASGYLAALLTTSVAQISLTKSPSLNSRFKQRLEIQKLLFVGSTRTLWNYIL